MAGPRSRLYCPSLLLRAHSWTQGGQGQEGGRASRPGSEDVGGTRTRGDEAGAVACVHLTCHAPGRSEWASVTSVGGKQCSSEQEVSPVAGGVLGPFDSGVETESKPLRPGSPHGGSPQASQGAGPELLSPRPKGRKPRQRARDSSLKATQGGSGWPGVTFLHSQVETVSLDEGGWGAPRNSPGEVHRFPRKIDPQFAAAAATPQALCPEVCGRKGRARMGGAALTRVLSWTPPRASVLAPPAAMARARKARADGTSRGGRCPSAGTAPVGRGRGLRRPR